MFACFLKEYKNIMVSDKKKDMYPYMCYVML